MEHGVLSRHSSSSMIIWSTSLPQTACVRRATAFPPLETHPNSCVRACVSVSVCVCPVVLRWPNGSSDARNRSPQGPAERILCRRHTPAAASAAHLSRQVRGTERQSEQHRADRDRRPGRCTGRTGKWTEKGRNDCEPLWTEAISPIFAQKYRIFFYLLVLLQRYWQKNKNKSWFFLKKVYF